MPYKIFTLTEMQQIWNECLQEIDILLKFTQPTEKNKEFYIEAIKAWNETTVAQYSRTLSGLICDLRLSIIQKQEQLLSEHKKAVNQGKMRKASSALNENYKYKEFYNAISELNDNYIELFSIYDIGFLKEL